MDFELLIGSGAFWERASADIAAAGERVFVQAMTFEADEAGTPVAQAVRSSGARDRRVLVDDYSNHVVNDRFVRSAHYLFDPGFRREVAATRSMFAGLAAGGVGVRVTNPIGRNPLRYAMRNHKKLIVADDVAYVGGINFSDHNFAWHDFMLRIEGRGVADFLAHDFAATWAGRGSTGRFASGAVELVALDGCTNAAGLQPLFEAIAGARVGIDMISAYPTSPFLEALGEAAARGVEVRIFSPLPNNKPIVRDALLEAAARLGIAVRLLPAMTHAKAMLIDGEALVLGSSNFDFASYHSQEEYLAILRDPGLIADFEARVLQPMLATALPEGSHRPGRWQAWRARTALRIAAAAAARMRLAPRGAADWP